MEPLHPDLRAALKEAHPGLADLDIDRAEELLSERMRCDPQREPERIARLDQERADLIRRKMPHYAAVVQALKARQTRSESRAIPKVIVKMKKPEQ